LRHNPPEKPKPLLVPPRTHPHSPGAAAKSSRKTPFLDEPKGCASSACDRLTESSLVAGNHGSFKDRDFSSASLSSNVDGRQFMDVAPPKPTVLTIRHKTDLACCRLFRCSNHPPLPRRMAGTAFRSFRSRRRGFPRSPRRRFKSIMQVVPFVVASCSAPPVSTRTIRPLPCSRLADSRHSYSGPTPRPWRLNHLTDTVRHRSPTGGRGPS
jgi:hypothetical protein